MTSSDDWPEGVKPGMCVLWARETDESGCEDSGKGARNQITALKQDMVD